MTVLPRGPPHHNQALDSNKAPPDTGSTFNVNMSGHFSPQYPANQVANGSRSQQRNSGDFRPAAPGANGNGPLPVPSTAPHGRAGNGHAHHVRMGGGGGFDGPRSPPNNKSTAHVPCKFFRQGACQAGKACPFLHSTEPEADAAPCKYFQKGNCKFGGKCALAHIIDGRRVNRPSYGMSAAPLPLGSRINPIHHPEPVPGTSLLSMQAHMAAPPPQPQPFPFPQQEDFYAAPTPQKPNYDMIPTIDTTFSSHPGSNYGSPPNEGRLPISPVQKGLSVLDAPLPASFDSQGISHMARYGPIAASVPSRFGLESPPSSFQNKASESSTLRNLHTSAFGDDGRNGKNGVAASPPMAVEEGFGKRIMHSERFSRHSKMISASVGARPTLADDWDENFTFEEDLVPTALNDLLTPEEKMRRFTRTTAEESSNVLAHRQSLSGLGSAPADPASKVGSPSTASPSHFGALFTRQRPESVESSSLPRTSAFGHVGSPLRNSSLHPGASPALRATSRASGDVSPFVASPPRQASMSMITQQLQRTRLSSRAASASATGSDPEAQHPGIARVASSSSATSSSASRLDRAVSSGSVGIGRDRIDEEQEQGLFSMEEEEEMERKKDSSQSQVPKRYSGGWSAFGITTNGSGKASPSLGAIGGQKVAGTIGSRKENPWGGAA